MHLRILSLDLDWFNFSELGDIAADIDIFFYRLKKTCKLPRVIHFAKEHQYLYPWTNTLSKGITHNRVSVVNIDQHHDFYCLNSVEDFDDLYEYIGCGNFFAFIAHKGILKQYTWVCQSVGVSTCRDDLRHEIQGGSSSIRRFGRSGGVSVVGRTDVFKTLRNRKFDGFIIVRSPEYTTYASTVYRAVNNALKDHFKGYKISQCKRRRDFQHN